MKIIIDSTINADRQKVFDYIVPIDLSHIFKKYKYLPGVIKTNEAEKWFKTNLTRTVFFDDGNSSQEHLTTFTNPEYFDYVVSNFTSPLRFLVNSINGSWTFTDNDSGTEIVWIYDLKPKNTIAAWIIKVFILNDLRIFLKNSINIIRTDLENEQLG